MAGTCEFCGAKTMQEMQETPLGLTGSMVEGTHLNSSLIIQNADGRHCHGKLKISLHRMSEGAIEILLKCY